MDHVDPSITPSRALETVADRLGVGPWTVVIGALAVVAAAIGGWWAFATPDPPPTELLLPRAESVTPLVPPSTTTLPGDLLVHVDGAVVNAGVHEVAPGARVVDAVAAAGGLAADADRSRVNLARPLVDGERVWVPRVGEDDPPPVDGPVGGGSEGVPAGGPGLVDLNRADAVELETLPGVGPAIASAIIEHRDRTGGFASVDDLLDVSGIGPTRLAQLAPLVTV